MLSTRVRIELRRKHPLVYHAACAAWVFGVSTSPEVLKMPEEERLLHMYQTYHKRLCSFCGERGASVGCYVQSCQKIYHFPCFRWAQAAAALCRSTGERRANKTAATAAPQAANQRLRSFSAPTP
jgi:hypothetical protein